MNEIFREIRCLKEMIQLSMNNIFLPIQGKKLIKESFGLFMALGILPNYVYNEVEKNNIYLSKIHIYCTNKFLHYYPQQILDN